MDILWFRLPRKSEDPEGVLGYLGRGHGLVLLDRLTDWQVGFIIIKGSYSQIRAAGLEALRKEIAALMTAFPDRIEHLQDWKQVSVLSVESSRVPVWHKPGLLLIGDAAHVMYPTGSNGASQAVMDARVLGAAMLDHGVTPRVVRKRAQRCLAFEAFGGDAQIGLARLEPLNPLTYRVQAESLAWAGLTRFSA
jgi:2-polyprenyl-6-methoxyphenol hydroxylase-like FAD-dependent oxidoreductase